MQDRRKFLRQVFFSAGTAIAGAAILQACGNHNHTTDKPDADTTASGNPAAMPEAPANAIIDSAQMTQEDFDKRKSLGYVEKTPMEDKRCDNCSLYLKPEGGKNYGGCQLLRGPIAPEGYCTYWAEKQG